MTTQEWHVNGDLTQEFIGLFTHKKNRSRANRIFSVLRPWHARFFQQGDFFMIQLVDINNFKWTGMSKRNPIDKYSVTEAKKAALVKIMRQIEGTL